MELHEIRVKIVDKEAFSIITLDRVVRYLAIAGWENMCDLGKTSIYQRNNVQLIVPSRRDIRDYHKLIAHMIQELEIIEGRSQLAVYRDLSETLRHGDKFVKRFWRRVTKTDQGCWIWTGTKTTDGYGYLRLNEKNIRAHRASYEMSYGEIPLGRVICHKCDNPSCVNPDHLFLGTQKQNIQDASAKGRLPSGGEWHRIHRRSTVE